MRLTDKKKVECVNKSIELNGKDIVNDSTLIYAKLGQLEDIEDELGIDLITLLKALEQGIWIKTKQGKIRHTSCHLRKISTLHFGIEFQDSNYHWRYIQLPEDVKDYGLTWALTKEELK